MAHLVEERREEAVGAIAAMRDAATQARATHARAELMRHMLTTAGNAAGRPREQAVADVVRHWMQAWGLEPGTWPHVAEMERFSGAFHDYVTEPSDARDAAVRRAADTLERAFADAGTPIADQMAWRSECAHGWWADVAPPPPGHGRADREWPDAPFWHKACPEHCL